MTDKIQCNHEQGIIIPTRRPHHQDDEYDESGFDVLIQMQCEHFWYRGRHKILLNILKEEIAKLNQAFFPD